MVSCIFISFRVSDSFELHVSTEQCTPTSDLAPLEAFSNPPHQSTPEQLQTNLESPRQADPDGIAHSFDRSSVSFAQTAFPPFGLSTFRVPHDSDMVDVTGDVSTSDETQRLTPRNETTEVEPTPGSPSYNPSGGEQQVQSPFTAFLNRAQTPDVTAPTGLEVDRSITRTATSTDPTMNFVTSSDLEALERRFQVLVSEATASLSTQLQETVTRPPVSQQQSSSSRLSEDRIPEPPSSSQVAVTKTKRNPATRRIQRRERLSAPAGGETVTGATFQGQSGTVGRSKPPLQLNIQMFRKHPVFNFFVTAPVDAEANPHKWRCRVCSIELSLKTKGALEILSHYRTEAHLVREHRLRMETPGLPLYGKNDQELVGPSLDEAREKAEMTYPIAPTLGECYLLPEQYELPSDVDILDPSAVICSQIRILMTGLQHGGGLDVRSLWSSLWSEIRGPSKVPQFNWCPERVFVSIVLLIVYYLPFVI